MIWPSPVRPASLEAIQSVHRSTGDLHMILDGGAEPEGFLTLGLDVVAFSACFRWRSLSLTICCSMSTICPSNFERRSTTSPELRSGRAYTPATIRRVFLSTKMHLG